MADELPDAPWATGGSDLPDAPWASNPADDRVLANDADDGSVSSILKGGATAAIKGAANIPGMAGNLRGFGDYLVARTASALTGKSVEDYTKILNKAKSNIPGYDLIRPVMWPTGEEIAKPILDRSGEYKPETTAGRLAMAGTEAVVSGVGMGGGRSVAQSLLTNPLKQSPANAISGVSGQAITDATNDPLLGMAAGVAAPVAAHGARRAVQPTVDKMIAPFAEDLPIIGKRYEGTRESLVRQRIEESSNDLEKLQRDLMVDETGPLNQELVPGSRPTTGQLTGDKGILSAEREQLFAKQQPFMDRMEQQEVARRSALENQGPDGDVQRPSAFFQDQLTAITQGADEAVARITAGAEELAQRIPAGQSPETLGATLRASIERVKEGERQARAALYKAVDPDGSLNMVAVPVRDVAAKIKAGIDPYGSPLSAVEGDILARMASLPDVAPYKSIQALDSYLSTEIARERRSAGETPVWGRLVQMKNATMNAINDAVDNQIAYERAAVSAGKLAPENTTAARLGALHDEYLGTLGRPREAGSGVDEAAAASAAGVPDVRGEAGAGASGLGRPAGASGVPGRVAADTLPLSARKDIAEVRKQYGDAVANRLEQQLIEAQRNEPQSVYYPGGELKVRYEVVDLPSIKTSHDLDFNARKDYPQELQPRARESAPSRDQVNNMASRLQPERLGPSPEANSGAPIVGPDGVVESGNGRTMAIAKAYQKGNPAYRQWLESQGYDTAGMSQPVLIARRVSDMTPAQREFFTTSANASSTLRMSAAEQAAADAKVVGSGLLSQIVDGPIRSQENRPFVRAFVEKLPAAERGGILDKDGNLSQAGVKRIEAALAARAFDDAAFVGRAFDSADSNIRGLAGALTDAAGPWARMREAARDGTIDASHDITSELMNVVHKVMRARDEGRPVGEVLRQNDMFGSDVAPLVESLLFRDPDKGLLAGRQKIAEALRLYASESEKNLAGPRLFDDGVRPRDVLKAALEKAQREVADEATFETGAGERVMSGRQPNFDEAARDRLRAAKDSHIRYSKTFKEGPVGSALKGPFKGQYNLRDSSVPELAIVKGPNGYETARAFIKAAGNDPVAIGTMLDQAMSPLRKPGALLPNGTLKPAALEKWKSDYAPALRALDEVNPGFSSQFDNAARATELMIEAGAMAKARRAEADKSAAAKFLKGDKPEDALWSVLTGKAGPREMRELLRGAPADVVEGLRQIGVDAMMRKLSGTTEAGTSGSVKFKPDAFKKFVRDNAETIGILYEPGTVNMLRSIAADMDRSSRTMNATSIPGQSNTARDMPAFLQKAMDRYGENRSLTHAIGAALLGGYAHTGSLFGALGTAVGVAIPAYVLNTMRKAGMDKVDALFKEALLNPEVARQIMRPIKPKDGPGSLDAIARAVRRQLIVMPAMDDREGRPAAMLRRADGGAVDDPFERAAARTRRAVINETRADEAMGHKVTNAIAQSLMDAVMAPGHSVQGKFGPAPAAVPGQWSDEDEARALINQRNMDNRVFDLAGTMMSGGMPMAEAGSAGIFGGRLAATADKAALKRAEDLAASGASRDQIWKDTGWFQGSDKKWRFEIPDNASKIGPKAIEELTASGTHGASQRTAAGVLHHKELYDAYPELRAVDVDGRLNVALKAPGGVFYPNPVGNGGRSKIEFSANSLDDARGTLLHEMQHAVQRNEGFASGTALIAPKKGNEVWPLFQQEMKNAPILDQKTYSLVSGRDVSAREYDAYVKSARKQYEPIARKRASELNYRLNSGEVEARNVQARMDMTPTERSSRPPWETQDIPDSLENILRKYGLAGMLGGAGAMASTDQSEASTP